MKLKPMAVTFAVCLVLLIGGGFTYQYVAQEKPLQQSLNQAQYSHIQLTGNKTEGYVVSLDILNDKTLADAIIEAKQLMKDNNIDASNYSFELEQKPSSLKQVWQENLFEISEVMANKNYSKLPELMNSIESSHSDVKATASIDDQYVYISLMSDDQRFDQLLPLDGGTMGVWTNEK